VHRGASAAKVRRQSGNLLRLMEKHFCHVR
jgi:hypothetical protein